MRIGQTSFIVFISKFLSSGLGFAATLVFARVVGAEVLGYYSLVLVVSKWLRTGGEVGVASAVTKRMSESDEKEAYFTAGLIIVVGICVVVSLAVVLFKDAVNSYLGVEAAFFVTLLVVIGLPASLISSALHGDRLVHISGLLGPVRVGSQSLIQITLVVAGLGLTGMLVGYAAGAALVSCLGLLFLSVGFQWPAKEHFISLIDFAKYSWLGNLSSRSFTDMDFIVLGAFVSPALVGVYQIAWNLTNFVGIFSSSIQQTTFPELSHADARNQDNQFGTIITDSIANTGLISIPGLVGALVIGDRLLRIYGDEFTRGTTVLALLIVSMIIYDYQGQLMTGLNALDRPELSFRVNATFITVNIVLNVILVHLFGWVGAAVATVISATVGLILAFRYLFQVLKFEVPIAEMGRQSASAVVMGGVVFITRRVLESSHIADNVIIVLLLVAVGPVTYFSLLAVLSRRFRSIVSDNLPASLSEIS
ncbi:lipid II flippase MurJ [Halobellus limi]|uniref:Membrane protein involved in the export of O-antigen and teichoic acid n=1 Tax=Halobellus limi TaxID=699433 RepID=A0A1H5UQN4_9EURY|nr:polysaccharide biosynthesis C-terminal domain-containing protein [Halobellus limi]QCC46957.1 transporter [Halobellus limi]SEF77365.1 Membrane protein involved in the export of O-antigen and teichoic acid [Halobellus limi]